MSPHVLLSIKVDEWRSSDSAGRGRGAGQEGDAEGRAVPAESRGRIFAHAPNMERYHCASRGKGGGSGKGESRTRAWVACGAAREPGLAAKRRTR